jgi:hypothetical protein
LTQQKSNILGDSQEMNLKPVNPFAIGGGFLDYCVKQGWIIREGADKSAKYFVTLEGKRKLSHFGINLE